MNLLARAWIAHAFFKVEQFLFFCPKKEKGTTILYIHHIYWYDIYLRLNSVLFSEQTEH
jgi:hypothetical protein